MGEQLYCCDDLMQSSFKYLSGRFGPRGKTYRGWGMPRYVERNGRAYTDITKLTYCPYCGFNLTQLNSKSNHTHDVFGLNEESIKFICFPCGMRKNPHWKRTDNPINFYSDKCDLCLADEVPVTHIGIFCQETYS